MIWLKKFGAREEEAEDVFQEAIMALIERLRKDPGFEAPPDGYLFGAARYIWLKMCRKKGRETKAFETWHQSQPIEGEYLLEEERAREAAEIVGAYLVEMGTECRGILGDFYFEKMSLEKIAQKHGFKTVAVANQTKYRCMERLKSLAHKKLSRLNIYNT